jgi:hypothetical protein
MSTWRKLGVIAGAGDIPVQVARALQDAQTPFFVARIRGFAAPALEAFPGETFGIGEMGARFAALKRAGCDAVTFIGAVKRPDFKDLKLDARGAMMMPKVLSAARSGDDALMRVLVEEFEREGFRVIGPEQALTQLLAPEGAIGAITPDEEAWRDIRKGADVAGALGAFDVGQGCVVASGLVLALEAQEGTDAMLERVAGLPFSLRQGDAALRGVLVKRAKPIQERRIDLPTIGMNTLQRAANAKLQGIAVEAGGALIVEREALANEADRLGLFIVGFKP